MIIKSEKYHDENKYFIPNLLTYLWHEYSADKRWNCQFSNRFRLNNNNNILDA